MCVRQRHAPRKPVKFDANQYNWLKRQSRKFARDEDGALLVFGVYVFLIMLMVGGIGIDLMRFERDRSRLQNTLDRAVLAAADLDQTLDSRSVVEDYFTKAGLGQYLSSVTVIQGLGFRNVTATAAADVKTQFMHMGGIDTLSAPAASAAEESIGSVEISLVLDISGSMNSNNRLTNLKTAANSFVDEVLNSTDSSNVSISIIPYATQVNVGETMLSQYTNVTDEHSYSHCVNFTSDQFSKTTVIQNEPLERTAHFDPFTYSQDPIAMPVCPVRPDSEILPLTNDRAALHAKIDSLTAMGNTSIDMGVKWGGALLDPSSRTIVSGLIAEGVVDPSFVTRPYDYDSGDALKILVVMSDGQNTNQYMLNPSLRSGLSDVWYNEDANVFSVYKSNRALNYYWPPMNTWQDHPFGNGTYDKCGYKWNGWNYIWTCSVTDEPGTARQLTYPELFNLISLKSNAYYNYEFTSSAWGEHYQAAFSFRNSTAKDQYTKNICDRTKDAGVVIFSVGMEVPRRGRRVLQNCASSDSHYFDVDGLEISEAFSSIASSIRKLRLTQ